MKNKIKIISIINIVIQIICMILTICIKNALINSILICIQAVTLIAFMLLIANRDKMFKERSKH